MSARRKPRREMFACPQCGADVVLGAQACRECGSDARTGWQDQDEVDYMAADVPTGYGPEDLDPPPLRERPRWVVLTALLMAVLVAALAIGLFAWR